MNLVHLNNNNVRSNKNPMASHYHDKLKVDTPVGLTIYAKMSGKARVLVQKLPDSIVQQYLAKKEKNQEKMNCERKLFNSNIENVKYKNEEISLSNQSLNKKKNFENDKFARELSKPMMQQYLANTEMGCLTADFEDTTSDLPKYPVRSDNCTTDSLIKNLSGNVDIQHPIQMKTTTYQDQFIKSLFSSTLNQFSDLSYSRIQECNENIEKANDAAKENSFKKQNNYKKGNFVHGRRSKKNKTTNLCKRICLSCRKYVQKIHKSSDEVWCDTCKALTFFQCNACRKIAKTYSAITDHLLYRCDARDSYKCAHCKYIVKKKQILAYHITRNHKELITKKSNRNIKKLNNILNQDSEYKKRFENLIVLKKKRVIQSNTEWVIKNVRRRDLGVNKYVDSLISPKTIFNQPIQKSTTLNNNAEKVVQSCKLYCKHCDKQIENGSINTQTETYCHTCGTDVRYKCLKCHSTFESFTIMEDHSRKFCPFKKDSREYYHCSQCNYKSILQGIVTNHQEKVHGLS
ncbi:uncharacterized protein LOC131665605 isoform X2 [Phymastichus coffea]|uniref:uncharacterized protein LOC131665605 isoform X2 n=1 Tax=Phymastichus coffea TaxID=108790 RepID=UPI00273B50C7|nr:uncharacterized protein LOC131665605 isoform X2 [Phymastichus coffea]